MLSLQFNTAPWPGNIGVSFEPKVCQICPKWDKSGTFSDQISVHVRASSLKSIELVNWRVSEGAFYSAVKGSRICSIWGQSDLLWAQFLHPWAETRLGFKATTNLDFRPYPSGGDCRVGRPD